MNALEAASLVMIPSGYEDGTLGSLKPIDGSGDFTFSRGSNLSATRVKEDGYIEKGYENLLLQSNSFNTWSFTSGSSVTSGQTGYDGSNDAWLFTDGGTSTSFGAYLNISLSSICSASIYVKASSTSVIDFDIFYSSGTAQGLAVNLLNGSVVNSTNAVIGFNVEDVGNGWYRISFTANVVNALYFRFGCNGAGSILIQDAQLNQGLVALPYVESGATNGLGGLLENEPRIDFTGGGCGSLLLEPSRTNLVPSSEYLLSIPWNSNTLTFNWETSIINLEGYYGVQKITGVGSAVYNNMASGINIGDKLCYSIWAKSSSNANFKFGGLYGGENATFNVSTGTLVAQGSRLDSYEVVDYGNGWRRYVIVITYSGAAGNKAYGHIEWDGASEPVYLWGLQLEQDATYKTSYIPTYGVSQTRAVDDLTPTPFSIDGLFGATSGSIFMEFTNPLQGLSNNWFYMTGQPVGGSPVSMRVRGYWQMNMQGLTWNPSSNLGSLENAIKVAVKWGGGVAKLFINGSEDAASTYTGGDINMNVTLLSLNGAFNFAQNNANFKQILFFQEALSDSELAALTTI